MGISNDKQNRALLLHHGGLEVDEIFDTVQDVGKDKDYKKAVEKLTAHFNSIQRNLRSVQFPAGQGERMEKPSTVSTHV